MDKIQALEYEITSLKSDLQARVEIRRELIRQLDGFKSQYNTDHAEIKKLSEAIEKISRIDWSHTKESDHVKLNYCITWAEEVLEDGKSWLISYPA